MVRKTGTLLLFCFLSISALAGNPGENDPEAARMIFQEANEARIAEGLRPLEWDDRLAQSAFEHTKYMIRWGKLSHDLPGEPSLRNRIAKTNLRLNRSGENVAFNSQLDRVHDGFMSSPGHRSNILNPQFNAMGVSVVRSGDVYWVTQNFAWRLDEMPISRAEKLVGSAVEWHFSDFGLGRSESRVLADAACEMARDGRVQPAYGWRVQGGRQSFAYTTSDPSQLPGTVRRARLQTNVRSYAVGACFERSSQYPSGTWWVLLVFVAGAAAS